MGLSLRRSLRALSLRSLALAALAAVSLAGRDFYSVLGVKKTADDAALKRAYRKLALKYHPDRLPPDVSDEERKAAETKFSEAANAYETLSDPEKRRVYDQVGEEGLKRGGGGGPGGPGGTATPALLTAAAATAGVHGRQPPAPAAASPSGQRSLPGRRNRKAFPFLCLAASRPDASPPGDAVDDAAQATTNSSRRMRTGEEERAAVGGLKRRAVTEVGGKPSVAHARERLRSPRRAHRIVGCSGRAAPRARALAGPFVLLCSMLANAPASKHRGCGRRWAAQ